MWEGSVMGPDNCHPPTLYSDPIRPVKLSIPDNITCNHCNNPCNNKCLEIYVNVYINLKLVPSQNEYFVCKWKFHSKLAARGFPFSNNNKICNENVNPISVKKINFRWVANQIFLTQNGIAIWFILIFRV